MTYITGVKNTVNPKKFKHLKKKLLENFVSVYNSLLKFYLFHHKEIEFIFCGVINMLDKGNKRKEVNSSI